MSTLYDLTLKKEVARECAWGVMGTISRIENKKGENEVLNLIEKKVWEKTMDIPKMTLEEVEKFDIEVDFLISLLSELEGK
ncbi:hypothetical protein [Fusobacterium massiliense]|uniref:hypothetical protein n=1 Tax=Fusobacterium massiliense TaxID=1852365 RepID=UPI00093CEE81|nr:hypothetical protein [Fusobacterium massiliense]